MKSLLLVAFTISTSLLTFAQLTNTTGEATAVPYDEVTHEQKQGSVTLKNGKTISGTITYSEYGNQHVKLRNADDELLIFENPDSLQSMTIEGRGTFYPIKLSPNAEGTVLVLEDEKTEHYTIYKNFQSGAGLLGHKIQGGNIEGSYDYLLHHNRTGKLHNKKNVRKLKKNIEEFVDYCPEVTDKVQAGKKGYKVSLLVRDFDILKKVITEADTNCPQ